jgi:hypothetical protein
MALAVAVIADGLQAAAGPPGWLGFDQVVDLVAMVLITLLLGFHPLFLPTFIAELVPGLEMLPTWTGCVAIVIALRRKQQQPPAVPPRSSPPPAGDVIDI